MQLGFDPVLGTAARRRIRRVAFVLVLLAPAAVCRALPPTEAAPLQLLGQTISPGSYKRLSLVATESFSGGSVGTPIVVAHGLRPGPLLCLTGGVHGDELNGVEIVRRTLEALDPSVLSGTVVGVPIANVQGFRTSSRYLPDRRDLNRYFPGRSSGSVASRIAHALFEGVIRRCDALIDFHTGSFHRTNIPHLRANLLDPRTRQLAEHFGTSLIVHNVGQPGTLRRAANDAGIPAATYEGGEPMRLSQGGIRAGVAGALNLMAAMGLSTAPIREVVHRVHSETHWVRADGGGLLLGEVGPGEPVDVGSLLGTVTDPISSKRSEIRSPYRGLVLGRALDQVVMPGFAAFHIAVESGALDPLAGLEEPGDPDAVLDEPLRESEERPE